MKVDELLIKNHDDFSCTSIVDFMATYIGQAESVLLLSHDKSQQSLFDKKDVSRKDAIIANKIKLLKSMMMCKILYQRLIHLYATEGDPEE